MKTEKQRAPQQRPATDYSCSRFEEKDFLAFLKNDMGKPMAEAFLNHIEACDECAERLYDYRVRLALCEDNASNENSRGEE
jgi:hypothetical protein